MAIRMKGIYKGFKFISQMFVVVKEREMEIGFPTDVKHVAHIGWDGPSGNAPSWMNEFKTAPATSSSSLVEPTWSSQDFEQSMGGLDIFQDIPQKKSKQQKKTKSKSSSSFRSSGKSKTNFMGMEVKMEIKA